MKRAILGLSCGFHDSASCLVDTEGQLIYASSEERFSRVKGDCSFPWSSINQALAYAGDQQLLVSKVCFHEDPLNSIIFDPSFKLRRIRLAVDKARQVRKLATETMKLKAKLGIKTSDIFYSSHHLAHLYASRAFSSNLTGIGLVLDAVGERSSGLIARLNEGTVEEVERFSIEQSIGLFYSAITVYAGFKVLTGEYKLMGLAPYGSPRYIDQLESVFGVPEIAFSIADLDPLSDTLYSQKLEKILPFKPREQNKGPILQCHADLAASAQQYLERYVKHLLMVWKHRWYKHERCSLVFGGGVALNCKLNYELSGELAGIAQFEHIVICPASGDAGSSIGACLHYLDAECSKSPDYGSGVSSVLVGSHSYGLRSRLESENLIVQDLDSASIAHAVQLMVEGYVGAIFSGNSEFGPRALGNRSIIAAPNLDSSVRFINSKIKSREDFRPLAPIVLSDRASDYFDIYNNSAHLYPYMLTLARSKSFKGRYQQQFNQGDEMISFVAIDDKIPSVVHVDGTSRLQIIAPEDERLISVLLRAFYDSTGIPILVNTSFNVRGEPIVDTIEDAIRCFKAAELAFLITSDGVVFREDQSALSLLHDQQIFPLD